MEVCMFFVEFSQVGWNWFTFSSAVLFVLTLWQMVVYWKQGTVICEKQSIAAISPTAMVVVAVVLLAFLMYGVKTRSLVILMNGVAGLLFCRTLYYVFRYGDVRWPDRLLLATGTVGLVAFSMCDSTIVFLMYGTLVAVPLVFQIETLVRQQHRGVLRWDMPASWLAKNMAFVVFAFTLHGTEPVLKWWGPVWLVLSAGLLMLWLYMPPSKPEQ
jgi:hypothetical protein